MRRDMKKVIVIAAIIAVIVCILIVGAILFLTTDIFKSDEEMFFKYFAQNIEVAEKYLEDPTKAAMDLMKDDSYMINSNIELDLVSTNPDIANQTTPPRNFNISYAKNADPQNDRDYSEVKIKYLTKDLFTAQYAHDGDIHAVNGVNAITNTPLFNIYLGIENNNLKQLAQKLGIQDISNIPNRIEKFSLTDLLSLTSQEKEYIQNVFAKVVTSQISKDKYYHNKGVTIEIDKKSVKANSYGVTLTSEEYKNLIVEMLNEVSQDETILNMLLQKVTLIDSKTDMTINEIRQQIQNQIAKINQEGIEDGIQVQVYEVNGQIVRTQIERNSAKQYIFDYERGDNSIRILISLNYTYTKMNQNEQQTDSNTITVEDGYQMIEGSAPIQNPTVEEPESTTITIKSIELAKETTSSGSNVIAILTYQNEDSLMTVSVQNKTEQDNAQGFNNNIIVKINDSEITVFTIKANSKMVATNNISVQALDGTNSAVLNNRTPENIKQLLDAIKNQLKVIYEQQMQVAKEVQEQENAQNGLTQIDPNSPESNTITNRDNIIDQ